MLTFTVKTMINEINVDIIRHCFSLGGIILIDIQIVVVTVVIVVVVIIVVIVVVVSIDNVDHSLKGDEDEGDKSKC